MINWAEAMHAHSHDHSHHSHSHGAGSSHKMLLIAIVFILIFAVIEAFGGWWAKSLALLSDAGHMASDAVALGIAAFAAWVSVKPPSQKHSYGLGRAEVIAAWVSSLLMLAVSVTVIVEAFQRIHRHPTHVNGTVVMVIAAIGLVVNLFVAWLLTRGERTINIRAALLHVISDMLGSFAALVSGAVIYVTGWMPIDPILSILIAILIMISSLRLLRESMLILMEGVPAHINPKEVTDAILAIEGVKDIHDLHIWTLSSGRIALSTHIDIHDLTVWKDILAAVKALLKKDFNITHITLQPEPDIIECQPCNGRK